MERATGNLFDFYCDGAYDALLRVEKAIRRGVLLTRREKIDFLFKVYVTGKYKKAKFVDVDKFDKDLSKFMACYFLKASEWLDDAYSFAKIRKFVSGMLFKAWCSGFTSSRVSAKYSDSNGVLTVQIYKYGEMLNEYHISNTDDLMDLSLSVLAYVVSDSEEEDRRFLEDYVYIEMSRYMLKKKTLAYVDKRKHSLSEVINMKDTKVSKRSEKVVELKFG